MHSVKITRRCNKRKRMHEVNNMHGSGVKENECSRYIKLQSSVMEEKLYTRVRKLAWKCDERKRIYVAKKTARKCDERKLMQRVKTALQ